MKEIEKHEHVPTETGRAFLFAKCVVCGKVITRITKSGNVRETWRPV